jgi:alpha-mannosidase
VDGEGWDSRSSWHEQFCSDLLCKPCEFNQTAAMKFSLEHQNPLVTGAVTGTTPFYSEKDYSLLTISDPDVLLWAVKPAEDGIGQGIFTRVWNQANS